MAWPASRAWVDTQLGLEGHGGSRLEVSLRVMGDYLVIVSMCADPEPIDSTRHIKSKCSIVITDSDRPQLSDAFEVKRRMTGIGFQKPEILVRQGASIFGESVIGGPKS